MKGVGLMYFHFIVVLRFIAMLLITNSHYDKVWPISAFATGGSLGNVLFFAITGFCISYKNEKFINWIKKKVKRIYPQTIIVSIIMFIIIDNKIYSIVDIIKIFIYPTQFWFISCIMLFYTLWFFINKYFKNYIIRIYILSIVMYFTIYVGVLDTSNWVIENSSQFKWIYYFIIMMSGYTLRINLDKFKVFAMRNKKMLEIGLVFSIILYFLFKILISKYDLFMHLQFITHIISFIFMICCFSVGINNESKLKQYNDSKVFNMITLLGNLTLEIYLVQTLIIRLFSSVIFPLNFILITGLIVTSAIILKRLSNYIFDYISKFNFLRSVVWK